MKLLDPDFKIAVLNLFKRRNTKVKTRHRSENYYKEQK